MPGAVEPGFLKLAQCIKKKKKQCVNLSYCLCVCPHLFMSVLLLCVRQCEDIFKVFVLCNFFGIYCRVTEGAGRQKQSGRAVRERQTKRVMRKNKNERAAFPLDETANRNKKIKIVNSLDI